MQNELACLFGANNTLIGTELGNLQKQIDLISGTDTAAITNLQTQITNLVNLLDGDSNTEGMQNLQNLLALIDRVAALEGWKTTVDDQISQISVTIAAYEDRIANLEQGGGSGGSSCDCEAIAADISALQNAITALQGVDATQAAQIATLNGRVDALLLQVTNLSEQLAGLAADVASAEAKAQQAVDGLSTLTTAVNTLRDREDARHTEHEGKINMIRGQLYGAFGGLCDALTPSLASSLAAAKAAAMA
jgi:predicted  nucleic acid-binding Zn-ribbon protein